MMDGKYMEHAMDLDHYHYHDGRPVSFDRTKVIHLEPHESGAGSFVRIAYEGGTTSMHLLEEYEFLKARLADGKMTRIFREKAERRGEVFDSRSIFGSEEEVPF